jgi:hypothetical protein
MSDDKMMTASELEGSSPALRAQEEFGDGLPYLPDGAMDPLYVLLERLDQQDDKLSADAARKIRKMRHAAEAGHAMRHYVQALELKIAAAKELIGAKNDSLGSAVKEANINRAWHRLNEAEGIIWNAHRYWSQPQHEVANQPAAAVERPTSREDVNHPSPAVKEGWRERPGDTAMHHGKPCAICGEAVDNLTGNPMRRMAR